MRRTFWPCLAMALALVLLGGCSGKPAPKEPDPSGSVGPEATATPPPLPEAATHETAEGATVFLQYFVDVLNHASVTGSVNGLEEISSSTCTSCSKLVSAIEDVYAAGGKYTNGEWSLGPIATSSIGDVVRLSADVTAAEGTLTQSSDDEAQVTPPDLTFITFELEFIDGGWHMRQFAGGES